ncbi:D-amino acid aminotransferase [Steroidobacter cummioxidans]|uniref:D-amino acid aminotransferase n=1 Tax=Steroidobacter cummioxidans TaxID=1803913 RepID=UPI000E31B52A|nr:D-amino acid aminotransferase [Steroidobacter cummioxidans]
MPDPLPQCYLNGEYLALRDARISPLDRGFLFGDSVYEVLPVFGGRMFLFREHFDRLARSLREIRLENPHTHEQWRGILDQLIALNGGGSDSYIYVQVSRGMEYGRNHAFPAVVKPTVFVMASPMPVFTDEQRATGLSAITLEDFRWGRCDIKSTSLLANVLMKQQAADAGASEALIVRDGQVLEGSSSSVFIVKGGVLITPPNSHRILPGTTRDAALSLATNVMPIEIRSIALEELRAADEVWISAATRDVLPVTRVDGAPIGSGRPGPAWLRMADSFLQLRQQLADTPADTPGR